MGCAMNSLGRTILRFLFAEDGRLQLIDFGIAAPLAGGETRLRPGAAPGSPGYMAP